MRPQRHLRLVGTGRWHLRALDEAKPEIAALLAGRNIDRATQLRALLSRVLVEGKAKVGLDVKDIRVEPVIYELIFDYRQERWRLYLADSPIDDRVVLLCRVAQKRSGAAGLVTQDQDAHEAAARYERWLAGAVTTRTEALASTQVDANVDDGRHE